MSPCLALLLLLILSAPFAGVAGGLSGRGSALMREEGAMYLEDFLDKPIRLKVKNAARSYYSLKGKRYLGTLRGGQTVTVLAISNRAYRVRGIAQQGQVAGWISPKNLAPLKKDFVENLKKAYERMIIVEDLIAQNQVALGMTLEEVRASLGKPSRKSSKLDKTGRKDTYDYITYKRIPSYRTVVDRYGHAYQDLYYVKVETGRISIEFENEIVSSIAETEGGPSRAGGDIPVVPRPVIIF